MLLKGSGWAEKIQKSIGFISIAVFLIVKPVWAVTQLKKVQVTDHSHVDLLFDAKISKAQIKTEYINEIVQVSVTDVSVYPPKILSVTGSELTKVFAYQYGPKLARFRFSVKGKAENYKDKINLKLDGKLLTVAIGNSPEVSKSAIAEAKDSIAQTSAAPALSIKKEAPTELNSSEKELLEKVMKGSPSAPSNTADEDTSHSKKESKNDSKSEKVRLGRPETKTSLSPIRPIATSLLFLSIVGMIIFFVVKKAGQKSNSSLGASFKGLSAGKSVFGRILKAGLGGNGQMIEVLANHHLGPKKSISVVKISGKVLVLGVTDENINLISQLEDGEQDSWTEGPTEPVTPSTRGTIAQPNSINAYPNAKFNDLLMKESGKPSLRAQIKSRTEGLKPL